MKNLDIYFEKTPETKKEYLDGVRWLTGHGFLSMSLSPTVFYGKYKPSADSGYRYSLNVEWNDNAGWKATLGENQHGYVLAVEGKLGDEPVPSFESPTLWEALESMINFLENAERENRLCVVKPDVLLWHNK